jgi:sec-independent protein translocase protein TatC
MDGFLPSPSSRPADPPPSLPRAEAINTDLPTAPLVVHLLELRTRVLWALGGIIIATILAWVFVEPIYGFLVRPLADAMGTGGTQRLIYTNLTEAFFTYLRVAFFTGIFVAMPVLLAQVWLFMAPGLYDRERGVLWPFLVASPLLFYLGGAVVYYGVLPLAWGFFLSFQSTGDETVLPIMLEARVGEYLDLVMVLVLAFGLAFQLPVALMILARVGVITAPTLVRFRKYAIILAFVVAAPLTPPDIVSQTLLALPLMALYELSILLIKAQGKFRHDPD